MQIWSVGKTVAFIQNGKVTYCMTDFHCLCDVASSAMRVVDITFKFKRVVRSAGCCDGRSHDRAMMIAKKSSVHMTWLFDAMRVSPRLCLEIEYARVMCH